MKRFDGWHCALARARFGEAAIANIEQLPMASPPGYLAGFVLGGTDGAGRPG